MMYYDALTLAAMRDVLTERLLGGRVQRVVQVSELAFGLEIYAGERHQLLLSAENQLAGIFLVERKLRRGVEQPSPLLLLLRKYVRGARLLEVSQPAWERMLWLRFGGALGPVVLVCEVMGRLSNLILLAPDGTIMEAAKRIPPSLNRYRTILPKHLYVPPPPQEKLNPLLMTPAEAQRILARGEGPVWRRLLAGVQGISPLVAKEIVYRAVGRIDPALPLSQKEYEALVEVTLELMRLPETHAWTPTVAYEEERRPVAYAPYELTHLGNFERVPSIVEALNRVALEKQTFDPYRQARQRLYQLIDQQIARQKARLASLRQEEKAAQKAEELQRQGQAILAVAWAIKPGQEEIEVDPALVGLKGEKPLRIRLDPSQSPVENAQRLFRESRKMKAAIHQVPELIQQVEKELAYLYQLRTEVMLAEDRKQLDIVEEELAEAGYLPRQTKMKKASHGGPLRVHAPDGTLILVGRNSRQNAEVTFHLGAPDDIWLHAHGVPGSHVLIRCGGKPASEETLRFAAALAAYYSGARSEPRVQVDYTERRYVRPIKGARPGMVTYRNEQTLVVEPENVLIRGEDGDK